MRRHEDGCLFKGDIDTFCSWNKDVVGKGTFADHLMLCQTCIGYDEMRIVSFISSLLKDVKTQMLTASKMKGIG